MLVFRQLKARPSAYEVVVNVDDTSYPVKVLNLSNDYHIIREDGTVIKVKSDWRLGDPMMSASVNDEDVTVHVRTNVIAYMLTFGDTHRSFTVLLVAHYGCKHTCCFESLTI